MSEPTSNPTPTTPVDTTISTPVDTSMPTVDTTGTVTSPIDTSVPAVTVDSTIPVTPAVTPEPSPAHESVQDIEVRDGETLHINVHVATPVVAIPAIDLTQSAELVYEGPSDFLTIPLTIAKGSSFAYTPVFAEWVKQLQDAAHVFRVVTAAELPKV